MQGIGGKTFLYTNSIQSLTTIQVKITDSWASNH